jgi:hypothetical protein
VFALDAEHAWACGDVGIILARQPSGPQPKPQPTKATSRTWGHDSIGVGKPSETWYLAEGSTGTNEQGSFETWVLVQNPNNTPANVTLTYMTDKGPVKGPSETLAANSRKTYDVSATVQNTWEVSTKVQANVPVIAERAMYGNGRTWGHDSIGVSEPSKTWYLAEGSTGTNEQGSFETWILVQNPNKQATKVSLTYMTSTGPKEGPQVTVPANSRKTFNVADTIANEWEVSTMVDSNLPVIAERAMYGQDRTWGHDSIGVSDPATSWYLAEGCTGTGFETWVLVQNPNAEDARVELTYMTAEGPVQGPSVVIPARSRKTFDVSKDVPNNYSVSTLVSSDKPVIAERAMYGGNRTWGHDSIGTTAPNPTWYLAEGSTGQGFETWVLVQNPNAEDAQVHLTFMTNTGEEDGPSVTVPGKSRVTVNVAETVSDKWEVSTKVSADRPVIAERAMYGDPK